MLKITEVSLRDGHQSLLATRMRTSDLLDAAKIFEKIGFHSVEVWGGATYDTCLRYLKEDPFERLSAFKKIFKKTKLQMLIRGQNLVGYRHYADDILKEFVSLSAKKGIDIFRIFDALNDIRNVQKTIEEVNNQGKSAQGTICYTTSPVHTITNYVAYAKELVKIGSSSICIKDMAGLLSPYNASELIKALKDCIDVPLWLHSHATAGFAFGTHLKAIEAGIDGVDLANSALAEGTSHSSTQAMVSTLKGTKYDPKLDLNLMENASEILKRNRKKYKKFESDYSKIDTRVLVNQIPGGMISNLANQLKEQNALDKMDKVLKEIPNVRADFGYPPLVTPSSQIVGTQAVLNIITGKRYSSISAQSKDMIRGFYGKTPAPIKKDLIKKIQDDKLEIIECRPADKLSPELDKAKKASENFAKNATDIISFAMFGDIAKEFLEQRNANALFPEPLSTFDEETNQNLNNEFHITSNGQTYHINIEGSGKKDKGIRPFFIRVDGELKEVYVESIDTQAKGLSQNISKDNISANGLPQATSPNHIVSPMPGNVIRVEVKIGDKVKVSQKLAVIEAMKMEHEIISNVQGVVKEIYIKAGIQVNNGNAIMLIG